MTNSTLKIFYYLSKRKCPGCGEHSISPGDFDLRDGIDKTRCDKCDQQVVLRSTMFSKFFEFVLEFTAHLLITIGGVFALLFGNVSCRWILVVIGVSIFYICFIYVPTRFSPSKLSIYVVINTEKSN